MLTAGKDRHLINISALGAANAKALKLQRGGLCNCRCNGESTFRGRDTAQFIGLVFEKWLPEDKPEIENKA